MSIRIRLSSRMADALMDTESGGHSQRLSSLIGLTSSELRKAQQMAENKVLKWVISRFTRQLQSELATQEGVKITQKALKARIRTAQANRNGQAARLWVGIYALNLRRFGVGRPVAAGYKVGRRYVSGAFRATVGDGRQHEGIFRRLTARRLPIAEVNVPLRDHAIASLQAIMDEAEQRLITELKQAIQYLIGKKRGLA